MAGIRAREHAEVDHERAPAVPGDAHGGDQVGGVDRLGVADQHEQGDAGRGLEDLRRAAHGYPVVAASVEAASVVAAVSAAVVAGWSESSCFCTSGASGSPGTMARNFV